MEVEILVAEVGGDAGADQLFHILYDGTVMDEQRFTVLGGDAETIAGRLSERWADEPRPRRRAAGSPSAALAGPDRTLTADELEVAVLSRIERPPGVPAPRRRRGGESSLA